MKVVLKVSIALALLVFLSFEIVTSLIMHTTTPPVSYASVHIDPYPQGTIGWYTRHGNPVCAFVASYRDAQREGGVETVINMVPYYGSFPSKRWNPTYREVPVEKARQMCNHLGALLWQP